MTDKPVVQKYRLALKEGHWHELTMQEVQEKVRHLMDAGAVLLEITAVTSCARCEKDTVRAV